MDADYFIDTNILVYGFDRASPAKQKIAAALTQVDLPWQISWQVVQEFSSVALHRFAVPLDHDFLQDYLEVILWPHCRTMPGPLIYQHALRIQRDTQYRFYDSLIIAAALASGVSILYSEDLQHNRIIGDLRIINPFLTANS